MLSDRDKRILDFERSWIPSVNGTKGRAIKGAFGIGSSRYSAVLRRLALEPDAYAYAPRLVTALYLRSPESFRRQWEEIHPGYRGIADAS